MHSPSRALVDWILRGRNLPADEKQAWDEISVLDPLLTVAVHEVFGITHVPKYDTISALLFHCVFLSSPAMFFK